MLTAASWKPWHTGVEAFLETADGASAMGCLKGMSKGKPKPGWFRRATCGSVSKKKEHVCKPKKILEGKSS
jgi:hypothetical protein